MHCRFVCVTGSDTGVGKTVLTSLVTRFLRAQGHAVAALKPVCSGGREDAIRLWEAAGKVLPLDRVNPWHFRAPIAPPLAARQSAQTLRWSALLRHVRKAGQAFEIVVVEGAGGLLSPMAKGNDCRDLIEELRASVLVVVPNRLGAVNQARLVLAALPSAAARRAVVVLTAPAVSDRATSTNAALLSAFFTPARITQLPRLKQPFSDRIPPRVQKLLQRLLEPIVPATKRPGQRAEML
jgi:dethiobiotin synthetase